MFVFWMRKLEVDELASRIEGLSGCAGWHDLKFLFTYIVTIYSFNGFLFHSVMKVRGVTAKGQNHVLCQYQSNLQHDSDSACYCCNNISMAGSASPSWDKIVDTLFPDQGDDVSPPFLTMVGFTQLSSFLKLCDTTLCPAESAFNWRECASEAKMSSKK